MEVVLAVITLATAVKDMVELAEKIHTSFAKVSDNLCNAQLLATEIKQTINELKEFCEQHGTALENDKELRVALLGVITKLRQFIADIVPLIPSTNPSPRLLSRVKGGFKAWRNNDNINASIRELKEEIKKCQMNFMMMSVTRIQVRLNEMNSSTSDGLRIIQQGVSNILLAHNTISSPLHSSTSSSQKLLEASNRNIVAFAQTSLSTSTPIWKSPSAMKEQIIWDTYLKAQIDAIAASLSKISTLYTTCSIEVLEHHASPFTHAVNSTVWSTSRDPESLHRDVVMQVLEIRKTLENPSINTSVQEGAVHLFILSVGLFYLGMLEEAAKMGKWAVTLFRLLIRTHKAVYSPYLIHTLGSLCVYNEYIGNSNGALDAIEEAVRISEGLQTPTAPVEIRVQYGGVLSLYAEKISTVKKDHKRAIELAEQSVKLMEDINGIDFLPPSYEKVDGVLQVSRFFLTRLYQTSPCDLAIAEYAAALRILSNCLTVDDQHQEALDVKLRALPIFYDMPSLLGEGMHMDLAQILYELVSQKCQLLLPADKVLEYAEDCVAIYRRYAELNPSMYGWYLYDALWEKGSALNRLSRDSDALEVWKEIAHIAQQMIQNQEYYADALDEVSYSFRRLKRHEEAVYVRTQSVLTYEAISNMTTASQANGHYELCIDFRLAKRFSEAVDAAKKAVKQYRVLAFAEPDKWTGPIGDALSELADSHFSAGDHEAALNEAHESMQVFERHIITDPECVESYIYSLRVNMRLAIIVNNERRAIERMDDVLRHMHRLAVDFPEKVNLGLLEAKLNYGRNLYRLEHVQEARKYLEELIAKWEVEEYLHVDEEGFRGLHISALVIYSNVLDNQGHTDLALAPIRNAANIGRPFSATNPKLAGQTVRAMSMHARLLVKLGRYDEALVVAEGALKFNQETKMDNASYLVGTLHVVGLAADHARVYDRVVNVSQEAVNIYKSADFVEYYQIYPPDFCFLSCCLQLLSSGHANSGNLRLGLQYGQEAVDNAKALRANPRVASSEADEYIMAANGHLGAMYFANDRIDEARRTFEETRAYFTEKVKMRPGQSANLISILRQLGITYCNEGRHDEGHTVAQEAKRYLDRLAEVFPELHELVHIYIRHELTTPSLQVLIMNVMKEKLLCKHQADLSF